MAPRLTLHRRRISKFKNHSSFVYLNICIFNQYEINNIFANLSCTIDRPRSFHHHQATQTEKIAPFSSVCAPSACELQTVKCALSIVLEAAHLSTFHSLGVSTAPANSRQ